MFGMFFENGDELLFCGEFITGYRWQLQDKDLAELKKTDLLSTP